MFKELHINCKDDGSDDDEDDDSDTGKHTLYQPFYRMLRRLIIGVTIVLWANDNPCFAIIMINYTCLIDLILIGTQRPFLSRYQNY